MDFSKKYVFQGIVIFSVAVSVLLFWGIVIISEFDKLPLDYELYVEYDGQTQTSEHVFGELSPEFRFKETFFQRVVGYNGDIITINSTLSDIRLDTGKEFFHIEKTYYVNRISHMHSNMDEKQFGFLPNVQKQNYDFFHPLIFGDATLIFQNVEKIEDLEVYVFNAKTNFRDISFAYPQFTPNEILTDTVSTLWIEPISGNLIRYENNWIDYSMNDKEQKHIVQKGGIRTTLFTEHILIESTKIKIENITFNHQVIPVLFLTIIFSIGMIWILLTYMNKIKQESIKKEHMSIIGNVTSRITHDLKNPLSVIKANMSIIQNEKATSEMKEKSNERIVKGVDDIDYQINEILNFVRDKELQTEKIQLRRMLESSIENAQIPQSIQLEKNIPDITVNVDFHQLDTVFSNLITNSIQAIDDTGTISISVKETQDNVEIEFSDSGSGIPEDQIDKIFEPLFTTKAKGTGLGLASCKTLIEKHGGVISVKNNPTTFTIILPK